MLDIIRANAQSWGVKIVFGLIIIVFVFWGVGSYKASDPATIIKVNGTPIRGHDFVQRYRPQFEALRARYPNMTEEDLKGITPELKHQVLQGLLLETLMIQEGERVGVMITPQELRQEVARNPAFQNDKGELDPEQYNRVLKAQGLMPGAFEEQARRGMLLRKFQRFVGAPAFVSVEQAKMRFLYQAEQRVLEAMVFKTEDYLVQAAPEAEAVAKYYETHPGDFQVPAQADVQYVPVSAETLAASETVSKAEIEAFYKNKQAQYSRPERVHARHILILADKSADQATDEAARKKIEEARAQIVGGKDFAAVAKEISQDGSAQDGGDLGWFEKGRMVPEFEAAAFSLKSGELSEPVRTQFGWHLIKSEEKAQADVVPLAEVEEDIRQSLAVEKARPKVQDLLDSLREPVMSGQQSFKEVASKHNLPLIDTGMKDADALAQQLGLKPQEIQTIMAAPTGQMIEAYFSNGVDSYLLVYVTASEPAKTRSFDEVRAGIENQLRTEKAQQLAQDAAVAARAGMTGSGVPDALKSREIPPVTIGRDGVVAGFTAANPTLADAVFSASGHDWLPAPYMVDAGAALVRVKEIAPPNEDAWKMFEDQIVRALTNAKQERQYLSFFNSLMNASKIETVNMGLLDQIH